MNSNNDEENEPVSKFTTLPERITSRLDKQLMPASFGAITEMLENSLSFASALRGSTESGSIENEHKRDGTETRNPVQNASKEGGTTSRSKSDI